MASDNGNTTRTRGIVRRLTGKGFGFIQADDGVDYFFHSSASPDFYTLKEGVAVTFTIGVGVKGPRAEHVQRA